MAQSNVGTFAVTTASRSACTSRALPAKTAVSRLLSACGTLRTDRRAVGCNKRKSGNRVISGLAVRASIHMQSVNGSRADARLHDHSTGQRAGGQAVLKDSAVDQASMEQATTTRYDEGDGQSDDLDFGLTVALQRGGTSLKKACISLAMRRLAVRHDLCTLDSTYSVSNAAQHAIGPHESGANMSMARLDVKQEQEPHRFHERHEDTSVDDSNNPPPATLKTNDTTRFANSATTSGSSVEVKPPKFPDVVTIDGMFSENSQMIMIA